MMITLSLKFTIDGTDLTIAKGTDYKLISVSGLEAPDIEIDTYDHAIMDGSAILSTKVMSRSISVSFLVASAANINTARAALMSYFKPKSGGVLTVTRGAVTRKIGFFLATKPDFIHPDSSLGKLRVTVNLFCPDPYFYATTAITVNETSSNKSAITNPGDVPCGFIATITATGGSVVNPAVYLTGNYDVVYMEKTLANTDIARISTVPGDCFVEYEGEETFLYGISSTFFLLPEGESTINYDADSGTNFIVGKVTYTPRYLGV